MDGMNEIVDAEYKEIPDKKECVCSKCSHVDVCKYAETLTGVNEHLSEIILGLPDFIKIQLVCEKNSEVRKEQALCHEIPTHPGYLSCDPNRLSNVLLTNYLHNSLQQCCNTADVRNHYFGM